MAEKQPVPTIKQNPELSRIMESWCEWRSECLGPPENSKIAKATFLEIGNGFGPVTAPTLTPKQVEDLSEDRVVLVRLPLGSIVQDLTLDSPGCYRVVIKPTFVPLFRYDKYTRMAGSTPFAKPGLASPTGQPSLLYVPFRISQTGEEPSISRRDLERFKIMESWRKWRDKYLGPPENPKEAEAAFFKIRDSSEPVTAPTLTPKQVEDLSEDRVVLVRLPLGSIVQDLTLDSPECYRVVIKPTFVPLFRYDKYMGGASASPFVTPGFHYSNNDEIPYLYVHFRISQTGKESSFQQLRREWNNARADYLEDDARIRKVFQDLQ